MADKNDGMTLVNPSAQQGATVQNLAAQEYATEMNTSTQEGTTLANPEAQDDATQVNTDAPGAAEVDASEIRIDMGSLAPEERAQFMSMLAKMQKPKQQPSTRASGQSIAAKQQIAERGTLLLEKYRVEEALPQHGSEAQMYRCTYDGNAYVAKVYTRKNAIKPDVLAAVQKLNARNVARIYDMGTWNGYPVEVLHYYKNGSLEGKTLTEQELTDSIIPQINEGLRALHAQDIIHKDLKPSNIMVDDDGETLVIIDFGISSLLQDGKSVLLTKTGMTPEFSAPETFRNLFLEESDYYSLGITVYTLFCGKPPYTGASRETLEQYAAIEKIPFPENFPERLKNLILGLTFDIKNRSDKKNPNNRWTYDRVRRWCAGENPPVPNAVVTTRAPEGFRFLNEYYTDIPKLVQALAEYWDAGKEHVRTQELLAYFEHQAHDRKMAKICRAAYDDIRSANDDRSDVAYFRMLYQMNPKMKDIYFRKTHAPSMASIGRRLLEVMWDTFAAGHVLKKELESATAIMIDFLRLHLFSTYENAVHPDSRRGLLYANVENQYQLAEINHHTTRKRGQMFLMAYLLSGEKKLVTRLGTFTTLEELGEAVKAKLRESEDALDRYSIYFVDKDDLTLQPLFQAWLSLQGKKAAEVAEQLGVPR